MRGRSINSTSTIRPRRCLQALMRTNPDTCWRETQDSLRSLEHRDRIPRNAVHEHRGCVRRETCNHLHGGLLEEAGAFDLLVHDAPCAGLALARLDHLEHLEQPGQLPIVTVARTPSRASCMPRSPGVSDIAIGFPEAPLSVRTPTPRDITRRFASDGTQL